MVGRNCGESLLGPTVTVAAVKRWLESRHSHLFYPAFVEAHDEVHDELTDTERHILQLLRGGPKAAPEIAAGLGYQSRSGHLKKALDRLGQLGLVSLTIPDRPRSKNQKRQITAKGRRALDTPDSTGGATP
jgi:hypothetical protein